MIRVECEQGSPEWIAARCGLPTCSQFHRLLTPKKLEPSAQRTKYMHELIAEWSLGRALENGSNVFMDRGRELEDEAIKWYEMMHDVEVDRVGFVLHDSRDAGGSPDGLIGDDGGIEVKCLSIVEHVAACLSEPDPSEYNLQIQGYMWVTGRQWWKRLYYHPIQPPLVLHVDRDDDVIDKIDEAVHDLTCDMEAAKLLLREKFGWYANAESPDFLLEETA